MAKSLNGPPLPSDFASARCTLHYYRTEIDNYTKHGPCRKMLALARRESRDMRVSAKVKLGDRVIWKDGQTRDYREGRRDVPWHKARQAALDKRSHKIAKRKAR